jgi:hypothetical protein
VIPEIGFVALKDADENDVETKTAQTAETPSPAYRNIRST